MREAFEIALGRISIRPSARGSKVRFARSRRRAKPLPARASRWPHFLPCSRPACGRTMRGKGRVPFRVWKGGGREVQPLTRERRAWDVFWRETGLVGGGGGGWGDVARERGEGLVQMGCSGYYRAQALVAVLKSGSYRLKVVSDSYEGGGGGQGRRR